MTAPTEAELASLLSAAESAVVTAFVSALYGARGKDVARTDDGFTVAGDDLVVVQTAADDPATLPLAAATEVVTVDPASLPDTETPVITVSDLHHQLLYALDRERAAALVATHFDRDLDSFEGHDEAPAGIRDVTPVATPAGSQRDREEPPATAADAGETGSSPVAQTMADTSSAPETSESAPPFGEGGPSVREGPIRQHRLALVGVALVVGLAALAGPGLVDWPVGSGPVGPFGGNGTTANATADPSGSALAGQGIPVSQSGLPPGIDADGSIDEQTLADATEAYLTGRSYRLEITYREFQDGQETALYTETLRVENETQYTAAVTQLGEFERGPPVVAGRDLSATPNGTTERTWVDGQQRVVHRNATVPAADFVVDDVEQYIRWYLSVDESVVTDEQSDSETPVYRIVSDGDPYTGITNATGSSVITSAGLVREIRRTYDVPNEPGLHVVVTLRVSDVETTTAPAPAWAAPARARDEKDGTF